MFDPSLIRQATETLETEVRRLTLAYQRGLEDAYTAYNRALVDAIEADAVPVDKGNG